MQSNLADRPHRARFAIALASLAAVLSLALAVRPHERGHHRDHRVWGRCHAAAHW